MIISDAAHDALKRFAEENRHLVQDIASGVLETWARLTVRQQRFFAGLLDVADARERRRLARAIGERLAEEED